MSFFQGFNEEKWEEYRVVTLSRVKYLVPENEAEALCLGESDRISTAYRVVKEHNVFRRGSVSKIQNKNLLEKIAYATIFAEPSYYERIKRKMTYGD